MRLIDAGALKKKAQMRGHVLEKSMVTAYRMCVSTHDIDEAPTVDAEPVKHGRWKIIDFAGSVECSVCGEESYSFSNYCPHCGAKMDEEAQ